MRTGQNRPIWCGEHGENSNDNFTKMVELLRGQGIGMSWWPMKKFDSVNCLSKAAFPPGYQDLLNYLGGTNSNLSANNARTTLTQLAESVRLANTQTQTEVLRAIFNQPGNRTTAPYGTIPTIPGTVVYASDYDQGMNGHAYADTGWENVLFTTGDYTAWNERWTYRNGGVDIETCSDSQSNGYNVGFFKPTEWMKYTVDVTATGTYDIALRVANGSGQTSTLQIQSGDGIKTLATASVPDRGWGNWDTVTVNGGFSTTGVQSIRIANTGSSECNINSIRFTKTSNTIPNTASVPVSEATVSLKANNGGYLSWQSSSPYLLTCQATSETANAQFTLVDAGAGRTAFRASNGKFVRYSASDNKLYADADSLGTDEQFTLNRLNRSVAIQAPNSLFVSQNANDPVLCSKSIISGWEYFLMTSLSTTQGPPAIPLGVAISDGTVSWKSMLGTTHYSVQRRTSSGGSSFQTIATDISATSFTDPSPTSGATNSYRIISHAGTYASQPSAEVGFVFSGLPAGWNQQDIGTVGLAGTTTFSGSAITLQGSGADIWETADGCHFLSQGISGDFVITVRLASMSNTDYWAKAGLMVRETNAAGSKNVSLLVTPESGGTRMQWRISGDGDTSDHRLSLSNAPRWLRILRSGNTFIGWQSEDGATWTDQHTVTFPMNAAVQVGLAVTSHKNDTLNTATFQNVDIIALPSGTSSWSSFQNHWFTAQQIADVNLSSPSADANRDGFANLFSYGSGLSPLTSMSGISNPYPVILDSGGFLSITFPRLKNRLDYDFVVEVSSDLVTWNSGPVYTLETSVTPLDATREQVTVRDLTSMNASSRRFIRLKAIYGF
jgi:regulation of enolase protein 1 (concanavalin A-like superfamily)